MLQFARPAVLCNVARAFADPFLLLCLRASLLAWVVAEMFVGGSTFASLLAWVVAEMFVIARHSQCTGGGAIPIQKDSTGNSYRRCICIHIYVLFSAVACIYVMIANLRGQADPPSGGVGINNLMRAN